jgi:NodT family efflux transporter outer membrane factor (OMF) lipoprotein
MREIRIILVAACTLMLHACAVGPDYRRPAVETPERYKENAGDVAEAAPAGNLAGAAPTGAPAAAQSSSSAQWWTLFNDPVLDDLERQVNVSNQNLASSEAAYRQALAVVSEQRASFFPTVSVDAGVTRSGGRGRSRTGTTVGSGGTTVTNTTGSQIYQAGASAGWELDLWGRLRRALENAHALADASAADLEFAKLSIQGQLATAYLQLREADAEERLLADTVSAYQRSFQITQNRYNAGAVAKTDVLQAQTQLANAQDQLAALVLQRAQLEHAIAALVGRPASDFSIAALESWQTTFPEIPAGVPSTLLQRRPDIASAERRVAAANASIGIEEAAYFPSLTLTGAYDFISTSAGALFRGANESHSAGVSLSEALFNGGATRARVAGARASYDRAVADYRQSVLTAFQDVEDQLAASRVLAQEYEFRRQASEAADETERIAMNQYRAGTISYTDVVVTQTAALSARRALAAIALDRQTTAIALITALGGRWD